MFCVNYGQDPWIDNTNKLITFLIANKPIGKLVVVEGDAVVAVVDAFVILTYCFVVFGDDVVLTVVSR